MYLTHVTAAHRSLQARNWDWIVSAKAIEPWRLERLARGAVACGRNLPAAHNTHGRVLQRPRSSNGASMSRSRTAGYTQCKVKLGPPPLDRGTSG
eukprot:3218952-Prymnesium_polylepis.2